MGAVAAGARPRFQRRVRIVKPYRPSNGSEGDCFMAQFCERCVHDRSARAGDYANGCQILCRSLFFGVDDPDYPKEWVEDDDGRSPRCTAFLSEDDGDACPPAPDPDPRQLVLIVDPTEDLAAFPVETPEPVEVFA